MNDRQDLKMALADVRRAYRLVAAYQRRMLNASRILARSFENMRFYFWAPHHYDPPPRRDTNLVEKWSWDGLPYYAFSIFYLENGADHNHQKPGEWMLEINFEADTAFDGNGNGNDPDPAEFKDVRDSESVLRICAWLCKVGQKDGNWYNARCAYDWPEKEGIYTSLEGGRFGAIIEKYPLSELNSVEALENAAENFKAKCDWL